MPNIVLKDYTFGFATSEAAEEDLVKLFRISPELEFDRKATDIEEFDFSRPESKVVYNMLIDAGQNDALIMNPSTGTHLPYEEFLGPMFGGEISRNPEHPYNIASNILINEAARDYNKFRNKVLPLAKPVSPAHFQTYLTSLLRNAQIFASDKSSLWTAIQNYVGRQANSLNRTNRLPIRNPDDSYALDRNPRQKAFLKVMTEAAELNNSAFGLSKPEWEEISNLLYDKKMKEAQRLPIGNPNLHRASSPMKNWWFDSFQGLIDLATRLDSAVRGMPYYAVVMAFLSQIGKEREND